MTASFPFVSIVLAAVAAFAVGALWYSPLLFSKAWIKLSKIDMAKGNKKKMMMQAMVTSFIANLVIAFVLSIFLGALSANMLGGVQIALWLWLAFVAMIRLVHQAFDGTPFKLYLINAGHDLVALVVMSIVLQVWWMICTSGPSIPC